MTAISVTTASLSARIWPYPSFYLHPDPLLDLLLDLPADVPLDIPTDIPLDVPADVSLDVLADVPLDVPADVLLDVRPMSSSIWKCVVELYLGHHLHFGPASKTRTTMIAPKAQRHIW
jgi:hypothetical protein